MAAGRWEGVITLHRFRIFCRTPPSNLVMRANPTVNLLSAVSMLLLLATPASPDEPTAPATPARIENRESPGEADPFASSSGMRSNLNIPANKGGEPRATLALRLEIWELDARQAVSMLDSAPAKEAAEKVRPQLTADTSAKLVHSQLLTLDERNQSSNEAIVEQIYPTEYEPPEVPPQPAVPAKGRHGNSSEVSKTLQDMLKFACPSAFDTRNTGLTFEAQIQPVQAEPQCWDTSLTVEEVLLIREDQVGTPQLDMSMPVFSSFRINTALRLTEARWQILGLAEPPRSKPDEPANRRWLTFVRIDRAR